MQLIKKSQYREAFEVWDRLINGDLTDYPTHFYNFTGLTSYNNLLKGASGLASLLYPEYVNSSEVRKAIHVGDIPFKHPWSQLVEENLIEDVMNTSLPLLLPLMESDDVKVMIYSGQLDIICATPMTNTLIDSLKWKGAEKYANAPRIIWKVDPDDDEVAGYIKQADKFTFAVVRNAGHAVPADQPRAALDLITRFIEGKRFNELNLEKLFNKLNSQFIRV